MLHSMPSNNYISHYNSVYGVFRTYHSHTILFGGHELSQILFPGVFHELKTQCKYPEMFNGTISAPSLYKLPLDICPTKLTEELRSTLADALLFIHTWYLEHPNNKLIDLEYNNYKDFFNVELNEIINTELDGAVVQTAIDMKHNINKIEQYLGVYHGNLKYSIYNTQDLTRALIFLMYTCMINS